MTDELLLERLSALGRMIDPVPWIVTAQAEAVFAAWAVSADRPQPLSQEPDSEPRVR